MDIEIEAPKQKPPETGLSLHSTYFPTGMPTKNDATGGLLASQQQTLRTLARDFKEYLALRPEAHLILQGHADPRGGPEYNKLLSQRRVQCTKEFLVEHGVPASAIERQAPGIERPMSVGQVKETVQKEPELTPAQRVWLMRRLGGLALAQSRRVDVTLSTTGETSARQLPFNAEDALNLIRRRGLARGKSAAQKSASRKHSVPNQP
ncbi:MAG TPA: OmpA family protein [Candidatus Angelobacter sp.]|nr:OmpA family protein [Candidatus Angelobacter sp.]